MAKSPTQEVTLDVPFLPYQVGDGRTPGVYKHMFREVHADHAIEYLDKVTQVGQDVFQLPESMDGDMFQAIRSGLRAGQTLANGNLGLLKHVTGIEDEDFLQALLPSQHEAIIAAYEACNASVVDYKKKLDPLYHEAVKLMAARATEKMLRQYGDAKPTE